MSNVCVGRKEAGEQVACGSVTRGCLRQMLPPSAYQTRGCCSAEESIIDDGTFT